MLARCFYRALLFSSLLVCELPAQNPPSLVASSATLGAAGRVDYSRTNGRLVFDAPNSNSPQNYFAVYTSLRTGASKVCLTCAAPIPQGQNGDPVWDPTGQYILFQAQDPTLPIIPPSPHSYKLTNPGYGENNNLWIMDAAATQFFQLTHVTAGMAALHPQWSHNGELIVWAEKIGASGPSSDGRWRIKLANLLWTGGVPSFASVQIIEPLGTEIFYETSCFSPDDSKILFTAGSPSQSQLNIYQFDLQTRALQNLTNPSNPLVNEWNELAKYAPDGKIVWASSRDITVARNYYIPFSDLWVMNADGSSPKRISYYNQPGYPEYYANGLFTGDFSFGPSSQYIYSSLEKNVVPPPDSKVRYTLTAITLTGPL